MKLRPFSLTLFCTLSFFCISASSSAYATTYSVSDAAAFSAAWDAALDGDSIVLSSDIDFASFATLADKDGTIYVKSDEGSRYSIVWVNGQTNSLLPSAMQMDDVHVVGAPATLYEGAVLIGSHTAWTNNVGAVFVVSSSATVGDDNTFSYNADQSGTGGGVFYVESGASLVVGSGNEFSNNSSTGSGGAIYLADNASLELNASTGDIVFANNTTSSWDLSNDIYFGVDSTALIHAESGYSVSFGSGIASADSTALINKTGEGDLYINPNSYMYTGSLNILEGSATLGEGAIWYGLVSVEEGASLVFAPQAYVENEVTLQGGNITVMVGTPSSQWTSLEGGLALSADSSITFVMSEESLQAGQSSSPLLLISSGIDRGASDASLSTVFDFSLVTSFDQTGSITPYNYTDLDADSQAAITEGTVSIVDCTGSYEVAADSVFDTTTGAIDLSVVVDQVTLNRPGTAVANAAWSSARSLESLWTGAVQAQLTAGLDKTSALWVSGLGAHYNLDGAGERAGYSYSGGGYAMGYNYALNEKATIGFAFGQMIGSNDADGGLYSDASSSIDQNTIMLGIYGRFNLTGTQKKNTWYLDTYFGYGNTDNDMKQVGQRASWNDDVFAIYAHLSYEMQLKENTTLTPYTGLEYLSASQDDFTSSGTQSLSYKGANAATLRLPIGIKIAKTIEAGQGSVTPSLSIAYYGELVQDRPSTTVSDKNGTTWTSQAVSPSRNGFMLRAMIQMRHNEQWSSYAGYSLDAASGYTNHSFGAGAQYQF